MKELERMKKNRDTEIKKLKKRIEDVQRASLQVWGVGMYSMWGVWEWYLMFMA